SRHGASLDGRVARGGLSHFVRLPPAPAGQVLPWLYISVNESLIPAFQGGMTAPGWRSAAPRGRAAGRGWGEGRRTGGRGGRGGGGGWAGEGAGGVAGAGVGRRRGGPTSG